MLLVLDPVPTLAQDLRALPPALAQPLFIEAVRPLRGLTHTPEGAWEAYRDGRCLPGEARAIEAALTERFAREPEYGRLASLGLAHTGRPGLSTLVLTAASADEEAGLLEAFWQILARSQKPDLRLVTYGGARWGLPFLIRRSLLRGLAPSVPLPLGRPRRGALRHRRGAPELGSSPGSAPRASGVAVRAAGALGPGRRSRGRGHDSGDSRRARGRGPGGGARPGRGAAPSADRTARAAGCELPRQRRMTSSRAALPSRGRNTACGGPASAWRSAVGCRR